MDISAFRFTFDKPELYALVRQPVVANAMVRTHSLAQHLRVSQAVLPKVHASVERASKALALENRVVAFVYPSPETNAHCVAPEADHGVMIFISSALVQLLDDRELTFVVGHELGHLMLRHYEYPTASEGAKWLRSLELHRAAEVSADRAGLIACDNLDVALSATLKVASGLSSDHLEVDIVEYLRQITDVKESVGDESILYSSHPPFSIRARALLRFESVMVAYRAGDDVAAALRDIDNLIQEELDSAISGAVGNEVTDIAESAAFWEMALRAFADGRFSAFDQTRLSNRFGSEKVEGLKRLVLSMAKTEAAKTIAQRLEEAHARLDCAPLLAKRRFEATIASFNWAGPIADGRE